MAHVGFFRVKQAIRLLFYKNSAVTDETEVDLDDIHKFLHFTDRLEVLVGRFNGGRPCGICVPLLHSLNRSNCVEKLTVRAVSVIYVVHKLLLIHSFTAAIFLKQKLPSSIVPIQMPDHGRIRLALGHNMMFMSTYSIPLGGEKILIHGWSQIMKARPSWRTEDYVPAFPWL